MNVFKDTKLLYYFKKWVNITGPEEQIILSSFEESSIKKKKDFLVPEDTCKYIYFIIKGCLGSYFVDSKGVEHIYQIRIDNN